MQNLTKLPPKAWVSLLWSQYNKLSEPLREGFINLVYSMAQEMGNRNINAEGVSLAQKVSETANGDH
jgi:hypothetical protein